MPKLAFLGVAHIHTPAFLNQVKEKGYEVAGVWDPSPEKAQKAAEKLGCEVVEDAQRLLDNPEVSHVIICTETNLHEEWVPKVAKAGKALFAEKPLGMATDDARMMAAAVNEAGIPFSTGYFSRGNARFITLKKWVNEGKFGQVTRMRFSNCHCAALQGWFDNEWRWMADLSQAGVGAFGDLGTHGLDILMWIGGPVKDAFGYRGKGVGRYEGCDETGEAVILFENGTIATLAAAWDDWADPVKFLLSGTKGSAWLVEGELHVKFEGDEASRVVAEGEMEAPKIAGFSGFLAHFAGEPADLVPIEDALSRCEVMDKIYKSTQIS